MLNINNVKGEVLHSAAPGLLLCLPEAPTTTKQAGGSERLCRLIWFILKSCFPKLGAAGKRNKEKKVGSVFPSLQRR